MPTVSRFEANLLTLLYFFLGREPRERALPLIESRLQPPRCLSRTAVSLVQAALAKGCVHELAARGGWQRDRCLRAGKVVQGRLWQRTPPAELALTFSRFSLDFLIWITAARPGDGEPRLSVDPAKLTPGDHLLLYLAQQKLRDSLGTASVSQLLLRSPFVDHALCRLAFPEDFAAARATAAPSFAPWTNGVGAAILEALQPELEERWLKVEAGKESVADPDRMIALGQSQEAVLTAFLAAVEAAGRLDLARFLLAAAGRLLGPRANAEMWTGALRLTGRRLADRSHAHRAALAFVRQLERLRNWEIRMRSIGYFDDGYAAAQLWKTEWARHDGETLFQRAQAIIRRLEPMRTEPGSAPVADRPTGHSVAEEET